VAHAIGGVLIDKHLAAPDAIGQTPTQRHASLSLGAKRGEFGAGTEHDEFPKLDTIGSKLPAQLVEGGADRFGLGDRVAATRGRHW
jgi:hypothetical protein